LALTQAIVGVYDDYKQKRKKKNELGKCLGLSVTSYGTDGHPKKATNVTTKKFAHTVLKRQKLLRIEM